MEQKSETSLQKSARRKRMLLAGALGALAGVACQLLPEPYQLPCMLVVKLGSLLAGGAP